LSFIIKSIKISIGRKKKAYRVRQKYLTILQNSCEWNRWRGEFVLERPTSEAFQLPWSAGWSVEHRAVAVEMYFKNNDSVLTQRIFRRHSIFIGTSVPSRNTASSEDISRAKVYEKKPRTTVDLKQNIREEVAAISPNMLQRVMQNFQKRFGECADEGRHLTYTVFRK